MTTPILIKAAWRDPATVLSGLADRPWAIGFLSGGDQARWSYVAAEPASVLEVRPGDAHDPFQALAEFAGPPRPNRSDGPPFQGGVAGLACYELGDRVERLGLARLGDWPDLACARYSSLLAFDHLSREMFALGENEGQALRALAWTELASRARRPLRTCLTADDPEAYEAAVADVVSRIAAGEIFQANIARRWRGRLSDGAHPVDLMLALAAESPAPFAAYLRLPDKAVVSNSPERFVKVSPSPGGLDVETRPIKGTAARSPEAAEDARLAAALAASEKDRAENLMIVDLMRNDLSRVCRPGTVATTALLDLESFANVHHLVSTVTGRLARGRSAVDLLRASIPPGSITGAPKVQAMKLIARAEAPRGPFFGTMFHLGMDGALDSSVLIRTAAFTECGGGWRVEARAGAGIVADSSPRAERIETEIKIAALSRALGAYSAQSQGASR